MEYLKIRNWDKWQSYRSDRGQPPWIKVHRCVMRNPEWVSLTDGERGQLVAIWLLAADRNGVIPASPEIIQKLCFMNNPPDIEKFTDLGFIDNGWRHAGVAVASSGSQHVTPDKRQNRVEEYNNTLAQKFKQFWEAYPRKRNKGDAEKAWKSTQAHKHFTQILKAIDLQRQSEDWKKDGGQFIPYPATWLRAKGWEDLIENAEMANYNKYKHVSEITKERGF